MSHSVKPELRHLEPSAEKENELKGLMLRSLGGCNRSYTSLMEKIAAMVRARLKRSSRLSQEQIEDLVQDVLLAVHNKRHTYRIDLPLLPWLHTITRYKLIDSIRAQGREPSLREWNDEIDVAEVKDRANDFSNQVDLESLLSQLPERQREILKLAKLEEISLQEIGIRMNLSLANVKVIVHRAMSSLKKLKSTDKGDSKNE